MPDLTALATTFRAGRFRYKLYLSYLPYTQVLAASINGTPNYSSGSIQTITVDTITAGSVAACLAGQTVEILTSAGVHKGYTRVAHGGGSGAVVQIAELSAGTINIADNDLVRVYQDYRIWDKLVSATAALNKDSRITYSDQGSNPNPIVNSGGPVVGFVSGSALTANFYGSTSKVVDPDSAGTITHAWTFPGATPSSSTDADPASIVFPAGNAVFATHVATDAGNSKASTQYIPVWAHSSAYPPVELSRARLFYNESDGWSAEFQVADDSKASAALMPDGCLVVIWYQAYYSGTEVAYGSNVTGRSHVRFIGYLDRAQTRLEPALAETTFTALSPLGVLAKTPALPQITIQKTSPSKWRHLKTNSVHRTLWYLWAWHNTAFNLFDFITPSTGDLEYKRLAAGDTSNQLAQYRDIASSLGWLVTCDRIGRLITGYNPQLLDSSARSGRTTVYNYTLSDLLEAEWSEPYHWQSKTVVGEGITDGLTTAANKPVFARAPGTAPASRGTNVETLGKQIVDNQDELNERTGLTFAEINSLYNGRVVPKGMNLRLPDGYGFIDPAYLEYATFTIPADTNARGTAFSTATKWLFRGVDETYTPDNGSIDISANVDHETTGPEAGTEIRRQPSQSGLPVFTPPEINFPGYDFPPQPNIGLPIVGSAQAFAVFGDDGYLYRTADVQTPAASGGPTFTATDLGMDGTPMAFIRDPQSPAYTGAGTAVNGKLVTSTDIYAIADVFGSVSAVSEHTFSVTADLRYRQIHTERGVPGWYIVVSEYSATQGIEITYTTDDGTTWDEVNVGGAFVNTTGLGYSGIQLSSKVPGKAYVFAYSGADDTARVYRTLDYGATWALLSPAAVAGLTASGGLLSPFNGNPSDNLLYIAGVEDVAADGAKLYRGLYNGSKTDITPEDGGTTYSAIYGLSSQRLAASPINRQRMILCGRSADGYQAIFSSVDGGSNWTMVLDQGAASLPIDYDATYWLSPAFTVSEVKSTALPDNLYPFVTLDRTYPGAVGALVDWSASVSGGAGNLGASTWDTGEWSTYYFIVQPPENQSLTGQHIFSNPGSIADDFPDYTFAAAVNLTNIRASTQLDFQMGGSFPDGSLITLDAAVRIVSLKSIEAYPGLDDYAAYEGVEISGTNDNIVYFWGRQAFGISNDFGAVIDDRMGNIPSLSSGVTFIGICGG